MHIPDASIDSVTLYSRAGFNDVSVCQTGAEINLYKENEEMSRNSFIISYVKLHDRGRLMMLVNRS